ncbi:MAG: hypothetical protein IJD00_03530 [Clostridia bacterium]|nr:hypothetical protein [Clostridia bacterium]
MKSNFKKTCAFLVVLTLIFSLFTGINTSALPKGDTVKAFGQEWEILEDEVYGCFESLQECVEAYDPTQYEEVDMDDSVWNFSLEVAKDWWFADAYYYSADGPVKDNFACISPQTLDGYKKPGEDGYEQIVADRIANYASSLALDVKEQRLAVTLRGPWTGNNGQAKLTFVAPKTGKVVLFNEGSILGATKDSPFNSFGEIKGSGEVEICIRKNDTAISEVVKISCENMSAEFPHAGTTGRFKVTEGDEIEIHLRSYDCTWENNTVFIDPVVAYTEVEEQEEEEIDDIPIIEDWDENTSDVDTDGQDNGLGFIIYVIIGAGVLVVAAIAVIIIVIASKKKKAKALPADEAVEEVSIEEENDPKTE